MKCFFGYRNSLLLVSAVVLEVAFGAHRFGFSKPEQSRWPHQHEECGGEYQSPIAIHSTKAIPLVMPAIEMVGYANLLPKAITVQNTGHTIEVIPRKLTSNEIDLFEFTPYIFGGKLEGNYEVEAFHFHWGDKNNRGAEHVLNDVRYAMELHIVHRNKKYKDMNTALENPDGAAVLGFFYEVTETDGPEISIISQYLGSLKKPNTSVETNITFTLSALVEGVNKDRYYTYKGSLTTPPCSESVTWVVFPDPMKISQRQISKFRHLRSSDNAPLVDNFRSLQRLGNRRVFVRKINGRHHLPSGNDGVHYSKWSWFS